MIVFVYIAWASWHFHRQRSWQFIDSCFDWTWKRCCKLSFMPLHLAQELWRHKYRWQLDLPSLCACREGGACIYVYIQLLCKLTIYLHYCVKRTGKYTTQLLYKALKSITSVCVKNRARVCVNTISTTERECCKLPLHRNTNFLHNTDVGNHPGNYPPVFARP